MSENNEKIIIFWFRRDLCIDDNTGLYHALRYGLPVVPLFIFDSDILNGVHNKYDRRIEFIYLQLEQLNFHLKKTGSSILIRHGKPLRIWEELLQFFSIRAVFTNHDYEPYAKKRDQEVKQILSKHGIDLHTFKNQVIFEGKEVVKSDSSPYTVYTPYKNKWLDTLSPSHTDSFPTEKYMDNFYKGNKFSFPNLEQLGFYRSNFAFPSAEIKPDVIENYHKTRDFPGNEGTSRLGIHLRYGTISIRKLAEIAMKLNSTFLGELIWRDFFMMILDNFPRVEDQPFKEKYAIISWINNEGDFLRWCTGETGYPMVDAGMRQLNETGFMHNRTRMITASFLTKHLMIDWRWGEHYFAEKLLDFELSSNNGNWQWAAGCGCDAVPYFRIFNPETQIKKFDPDHKYIKKWVPEYQESRYVKPIIEHTYARERAITIYRNALKKSK